MESNTMQFWLGFGIAERFPSGAGVSTRIQEPSFPSFQDAVESLSGTTPPPVVGQVTEANAYVVRAETRDEAADLLRAVFERHEMPAHVKLVKRGVRTHQIRSGPPEIQMLSQLHSELCITHQISDL